MRSEILTAVDVRIAVFWDVMPYSLVKDISYPENGDSTFLQGVGNPLSQYKGSYLKGPHY
jgi:hypothetical protein